MARPAESSYDFNMGIELLVGICGTVISLLLGICAYFLAKTQERNDKAASAVERALPRYEEKFNLLTERISDMNREITILSEKFEQVSVLRERVAVLESQQVGLHQNIALLQHQLQARKATT